MTQLRRILWFVVFAAALLLLPARASAQNSVTPTVKPTPPGQLTVVNNGPGFHTDPHVDGDLVCYTDQQSPAVETVRYFNLTTHTDNAVPAAPTLDFLCDVRGTTVVFTRNGSEADIFTFDTATSTLTELDPTPGSMRFYPQIGDQTIVWQDFGTSTTSSSIVAYDRTTGATTVLSPSSTSIVNQLPGISPDGSAVVWEACTNYTSPCPVWKAVRSSAGIWASQQISQVGDNGDRFDTDGTIIVYVSFPLPPSNAHHIVWQPVAGGTEQVLNVPGSALFPSVSGGLVAFTYDATGAGVHQIAVYDTASNVLYNVTADAIPGDTSDKTLNDISVTQDGKVRVVWQQQESGEWNVYAYTFNLPLADLAIQKFAFPGTVHVGQDIVYGLLVHNSGPNTASNVVVTDPLPANTLLLRAFPTQGTCTGPVGSSGTVTCNLGDVVNGRYAAVVIAVKVTGGAGTTITNTVTVGSSSFDPNSKNNSASVSTTVVQGERDD